MSTTQVAGDHPTCGSQPPCSPHGILPLRVVVPVRRFESSRRVALVVMSWQARNVLPTHPTRPQTRFGMLYQTTTATGVDTQPSVTVALLLANRLVVSSSAHLVERQSRRFSADCHANVDRCMNERRGSGFPSRAAARWASPTGRCSSFQTTMIGELARVDGLPFGGRERGGANQHLGAL